MQACPRNRARDSCKREEKTSLKKGRLFWAGGAAPRPRPVRARGRLRAGRPARGADDVGRRVTRLNRKLNYLYSHITPLLGEYMQ